MTDNVVMVDDADISQGYSQQKVLGDGKTVYEHQTNVSCYVVMVSYYSLQKDDHSHRHLYSMIFPRIRHPESTM